MTIRDFLSANDVLEVRTTAQKMECREALIVMEPSCSFFSLAKDDSNNPAALTHTTF